MGPTPHDHAAEPFRLLFVCTANRCRSPMAEYLARRSLARRQIDAEVVLGRAPQGGLRGLTGAVAAMARRKLDLRGHASAQLDPGHAGRRPPGAGDGARPSVRRLPDPAGRHRPLLHPGRVPDAAQSGGRPASSCRCQPLDGGPAIALRWPTRRGTPPASWSTTTAPTSPTRWAAGPCTTGAPPSSWQA
ncbi:MAG: hypothetical protein IPH29_10475 [Candidatus Microthrix sp.]|nr:hypothetical protein [Candidatus Microthrix sp.]